jgi:membrane protein DedA with SNARE-associated domain/membrane-associated phospholipid phosphatase
MESHLQELIAYFSEHSAVALAAVFAAAALEALALIGTVIPGSSVVFIGGVLVGLNVLDPWWTILASMAGAVLGDGLSYWLGHHYQERLLAVWPLRNYRALFDRGRTYFAANGGKSVFFGRFLTPVRAIVPVIAGMSGMPPVLFYWMNVASALAWSVAHILPGVLFGASLQVAGAVSSRLVVVLFVFAALLWLVFCAVRLMLRHGSYYLGWLRVRIVSAARRRRGAVANLLGALFDPARPESGSLLTAGMVLIAGGWLFLGVVGEVVSNDPVLRLDSSVLALLQSVRSPGLDRAMVIVNGLGGPLGTLALVGALSLYFALRRYWKTLGYWLAAAAFAQALVWVLKLTIGGGRPQGSYAGAEPFSFPGGNAIFSVVSYGFLAFLLANGKPLRVKSCVSAVAGAVIVLISFSGLYLGAHWLSDVLGSISLGLCWVALLSIAHMNHVKGERVALLPVGILVLATLGAGMLCLGQGSADAVKNNSFRPALTLELLPDWEGEGWSRLPVARSEVDGDLEEPFTVQWAGSAAELAQILGGAGWRVPEPWGWKPLALWLLPQTPIGQLPVVSKFDHGQAQASIFVKVVNPKQRAVLRLWAAPYQVQPDPGLPRRPLWAGTLTLEHLRRLPGLTTLARTEHDFVRPLELLQSDLKPRQLSVKRDARRNQGVLLVW